MLALISAGSAQDRFQPVRTKIEKLREEHKIPAISIGVAQDGKVLWEQGFGYADLGKKKRARADTVYSIGSTSKPITATAVMLLAEQGKLRLDLPVNDYLDRSVLKSPFNDASQITVRTLLNHTSGLSRHSQMFLENDVRTRPGVEETIRRYGTLTKPAGEVFEYSNLGYAILSQIVSLRSGTPFETFLKGRLFRPLQMHNSGLGTIGIRKVQLATAYSSDLKPVTRVLSDTPGAADIYSNVHDLLIFGMFHLGEKMPGNLMLTNTLLTEMKRGSVPRGVSKYGLGWESLQVGNYELIYHHGSNGYGTSIFYLIPQQRICISILSNVTTPHTQQLADDVLKILLSDYEQNLNEFRRSVNSENTTLPFKPSDEYNGHWKGKIATWKEEIPAEMWFKPDGDIHVQLNGQYRNLLNGVRFEEGYLRGSFQGNIGTDDANRHRYNLHLKLKLRNAKTLNGAITSSSYAPQGNVLTSWITLDKQP